MSLPMPNWVAYAALMAIACGTLMGFAFGYFIGVEHEHRRQRLIRRPRF